jgi:hypothetical protein
MKTPEQMRCAECDTVQEIGPVAECERCGSRQVRPYWPIPQVRVRTPQGAQVAFAATNFLSVQSYGALRVVELATGEVVETTDPEGVVLDRVQRMLVGGAA